jgi:hypothetical protein
MYFETIFARVRSRLSVLSPVLTPLSITGLRITARGVPQDANLVATVVVDLTAMGLSSGRERSPNSKFCNE